MVTKTNNPKISQWLEERRHQEHLSFRQVAAKTGLSHTTIAEVINGNCPSPETIKKLALAFSTGSRHRLALEDHLLTLAGYRTPRPREELSQPLAQLMDRVRQFSAPQLEMMVDFADYLVEIASQN